MISSKVAWYLRACAMSSAGWLRYFSKRDRMTLLSPRGMVSPPIVTVSFPGLRIGMSFPKDEFELLFCDDELFEEELDEFLELESVGCVNTCACPSASNEQ